MNHPPDRQAPQPPSDRSYPAAPSAAAVFTAALAAEPVEPQEMGTTGIRLANAKRRRASTTARAWTPASPGSR